MTTAKIKSFLPLARSLHSLEPAEENGYSGRLLNMAREKIHKEKMIEINFSLQAFSHLQAH
jgi:hypothetical protein